MNTKHDPRTPRRRSTVAEVQDEALDFSSRISQKLKEQSGGYAVLPPGKTTAPAKPATEDDSTP